jgi:hypothetical protein
MLSTILANPWTIPVALLGGMFLGSRFAVFRRRSPSPVTAVPRVVVVQSIADIPEAPSTGEAVRTIKNEFGTGSTLIGSHWGAIEFVAVPNDDAEARAAGFPLVAYEGLMSEGMQNHRILDDGGRYGKRVYMRRSAYDAMRGELSRQLPR